MDLLGLPLHGRLSLAGAATEKQSAETTVAVHHAIVEPNLDILRKFWELEEGKKEILTAEDVQLFDTFRKTTAKPLREDSSSHCPRNLMLHTSGNPGHRQRRDSATFSKNFVAVDEVIRDYLELGHAEKVPVVDLDKDTASTYYMPIHVVYKHSSTTTKIKAVFDASAKSASGASLNDTLLALVGPTVHPPLIDVLLRFRKHPIAVTADVSKMYRAVELDPLDRDMHRFVWRSKPEDPIVLTTA
jgi:hypothetical protein